MIHIYYQPHQRRRREGEFCRFLCTRLGNAEIVTTPIPLPVHYRDHLVHTDEVIAWLEQDTYLPNKRRARCIALLQTCPPALRVAPAADRVSVDMVVEVAGQRYYWEFHEQQHRTLKDQRPKKLYAPDNTPVEVPRFLQRLVRDVWRVQYLRPYTIVWCDWFATHQATYMPVLTSGLHEYATTHQFAFTTLCQLSE